MKQNCKLWNIPGRWRKGKEFIPRSIP